MLQLRIIGIIWMALASFGVCVSVFDLIHSLTARAFISDIESDCLLFMISIGTWFAGFGGFHHRRWASIACGIVAIILFLYAMSYQFMVGLDYGVWPCLFIWTVTIFSIYSLFVAMSYGRAA